MSLEQDLQEDQKRQIESVYKVYGQDESKWPYCVLVTFRCRAGRGQGFLANELQADLELGKKVCPFKGRMEETIVPHTASNSGGAVVARNFPEKCPLCGLAPTSNDFNIG